MCIYTVQTEPLSKKDILGTLKFYIYMKKFSKVTRCQIEQKTKAHFKSDTSKVPVYLI